MKKSTYSFKLKYEGAALDGHVMKVDDLAPSLLALSSVIGILNRQTNGSDINVELSVDAKFECGSFGILLSLCQDFGSQITDFLIGDVANGICNAKTLIECLIEIVMLKKWLQGSKPDSVVVSENKQQVTIVYKNEVNVVNVISYNGYMNQECNTACSKLANPLNENGIDRLLLNYDAEKSETISKEDLAGFQTSAPEKILSTNTMRAVVQVESPSFKDGNKWKVSLGERNSLFAKIEG